MTVIIAFLAHFKNVFGAELDAVSTTLTQRGVDFKHSCSSDIFSICDVNRYNNTNNIITPEKSVFKIQNVKLFY